MLDILYMLQVDLKTGLQKPIAWIDEAGSCFFPQSHSTDSGRHECNQSELQKDEEFASLEPNGAREINLHLQIEINGVSSCNLEECVEESNASAKRIKIGQKLVECHNELGVNDEVVEQVQQIGGHLSPKFEGVCEIVNSEIVRNMFVAGLNPSLNANILEINQCTSNFMQTRWEIFQKQVEITQKCRGDPNVRYAWLASSKDALSSLMIYGLAHCGSKMKTTFGIGIHLTSMKGVLTSSSYCDVDENGVRHLVFCRVILGKMELVHPESGQFHPSSENFDSGVDDLQNPIHYIVWNMNMNTHIYPEYVISFKMSHSAEGALVGQESRFNIAGVAACQGLHRGQFQLNSSSVVSEKNCHASQDVENKSQGKACSVGSSTMKIPKSPWMPFALLFGAISSKVAPKDMKLVDVHYELFRQPSNSMCPLKAPKEEQEC
ncbi:hypothetical protein HYC85_022992 [Camellia sinensis]|uniref:Poly [ADP-ribose] polymerase n=1 Tax=Camellia sinensis TaxID=4442 RepID=A0A7J7GD78_CAMSI|nr:hypothetical protein HYC85_022992 [Camellia sinensis]